MISGRVAGVPPAPGDVQTVGVIQTGLPVGGHPRFSIDQTVMKTDPPFRPAVVTVKKYVAVSGTAATVQKDKISCALNEEFRICDVRFMAARKVPFFQFQTERLRRSGIMKRMTMTAPGSMKAAPAVHSDGEGGVRI